MNDKKLKALLAQTGPKRYSHFVKVAADWRVVWGLFSDGWALASTAEGTPAFPLWPAREFAQLCCTREWSNFTPKEIDLDTLLDVLIPKLSKSDTIVAVFPTPNDKGVTPALGQLEEDLREELSKIE